MLRSGESNRAPSASRELHLTLTSFPVRVCLLNEAEINFAHERSWKEEEERRGGHGTTQLHHQASLLQPISFPHRRSRRRVVLRAAALRPQLASRSRVSWRILLLSTALTFSQKSVFYYYYSTQQKRFSLLSMHVQAKVGSSWTF